MSELEARACASRETLPRVVRLRPRALPCTAGMKQILFEPAGPRAPVEAPLVFIHIPKTAGTTLGVLLRHYYGDAFLGIQTNVAVDAERTRKRVARKLGRRHARAIKGHFTVGVSDLFPADACFVTLLRDPIDRTLSHYHQVVSRGSPWRPDWLPPGSPELTLAECLQPRSYVPDNLQTRMLCGLVSPWDELPPNALERAKQNLVERFAYVGTAERFNEFLSLLNVELGWPTVAYKAARTHSGRPRAEDLSAEELRQVEEANLLDRQLHAYAGELLAEALERAGPELERELEVLERALSCLRDGGPAALRSLPLETRVELALKERELALTRGQMWKQLRLLTGLGKRVDQFKSAEWNQADL